MLRSRTKGAPSPLAPIKESSPKAAAAAIAAANEEEVWEVRPGGMLVQKRDSPAAAATSFAAAVVPTLRVRVKYGAALHEIYISSQSTFGELKKLLSERTGLHPLDQKLVFKDKERDSAAFLDTAGVKDRSKVVLMEDPTARAKRLLETRRAGKLEKAAKSVSVIGHEVDKLASKVSALEAIVNKGGNVVENDVLTLIEQLMNLLIKLDGIAADGDVKQERRMQVKRVQKYVETLDVIKVKNARPRANGYHASQQQQQQTQIQFHQQQPPVVVTTKWETFDSLFMPSSSSVTTTTMAISTTSSAPAPAPASAPKFDWELF